MSYYPEWAVNIEDLDAKRCQELADVIDTRVAGCLRRGWSNPLEGKGRTVFQDAAQVVFQTLREQDRRGPAGPPPPRVETDDELDWTWAE